MRIKSRKILNGVLVFSFYVFTLAGCKEAITVWKPINNNEINIAFLGDEKYFNSDKGFLKGIDMAVADIRESTGITVNIKIFDDDDNYINGINNAKSIVNDSSIAFALTLQDFEVIDAVAGIFNEAKKPLIVLQGCYDDTRDRGYEYLISDFIGARQMGNYMGEYAVSNGIKHIISCHSDTAFEKDEIKGMQSYIKLYDTQIVNMVIGPFSQEEFNDYYSLWDTLGADAVYLNFYNLTQGSEVIKMLYDKNPDIVVMADYSINNEEVLSRDKQYLEGTVIVPLYPYEESDKLTEFSHEFFEHYGFHATNEAIQVYDMLRLLCSYACNEVTDSSQFIQRMKSEHGYDGISGNIRFDEKGRLSVNDINYLICRDGEFVSMDSVSE